MYIYCTLSCSGIAQCIQSVLVESRLSMQQSADYHAPEPSQTSALRCDADSLRQIAIADTICILPDSDVQVLCVRCDTSPW